MPEREIKQADWKATSRSIELVTEVLKNGRLTYGPMTRNLEENFAKIHERKNAIFVSSGTGALFIALNYLKEKYNWKADDEIIVPAITFVATVNIILANGLKPRVVDVDPIHFDMTPQTIENAINEHTKAIIPVHIFGQPCQIQEISQIAQKNSLKVIEDSCESMFVSYKGKPVGSFGEMACFSTYFSHILTTGVGGFITTNNDEDTKIMRSMIWHGRDMRYLNIDDATKRSIEELLESRFKFDRLGYNFRITEMEAALGLAGIETYQDMIKTRKLRARYLNWLLQDISGELQLPSQREQAEHAWMFYPIVVGKNVDRNKFAHYLETNGIETRTLMPLTNQPVYKNLINEEDYPIAKELNKRGLLLPCNPLLTIDDIDYISEKIHSYFKYA